MAILRDWESEMAGEKRRQYSDTFCKRLEDERDALIRKAMAPGFMEKVYEDLEAYVKQGPRAHKSRSAQ